ncbi:PIG-L deacetylase family protein [Terasakiella sp. SH-1]|uniref:PIG-L deacetylase family protein n=1 Tax=Terasakiella sp. SH-1 TaxID=2560057 RepID=UPI001073E824|nr:PIG-L deacetylase family protein [Terasakiella sp. SH-1]
MFDSSERFLIIAAHPDDEVLGCGATIALARQKNIPVRVVFLAEGVTARYDEKVLESAEVKEKSVKRNQNAIRALKFLRMTEEEIYLGSRYCCRLDEVSLIDLTKEIEHHIKDFNPTRIFGHSAHDANIDHRLSYKALLAAARPATSRAFKAIYAYEVLSSTEWNPLQPFMATSFVDVTQTIDLKIEAMQAYEDEMLPAPHPRSEEVLRSLAQYRGTQVGVKYAEAFTLIRSLDL